MTIQLCLQDLPRPESVEKTMRKENGRAALPKGVLQKRLQLAITM